uniref:sensor histidine kinase n=1 Tax=Bordetella sputigena TaxID=1416810 RepID=UPI0039EEE9B2
MSAGDTGPRFWRAQIIGWLCLAAIGFFTRYGAFGHATLALVLTVVLDTLGFLATSASAVFHARHPGTGKIKAMVTAALLCITAAAINALIANTIHGLFPAHALTYVPRNGFSMGFIYYLGIFSIWTLVYFGVSAELDARTQRMSTMQAETRALQLKLEHLHLQIEPHFLFNTLNTIVAEIADRPAIAEEMTRRLAAYLRYSLNARGSAICRLRDEVAALETYIGIQALRFGDRFEYRCEVDPDSLDAPIPHMTLQGLAENAIKHGMRAETPHFSINLRAWREGAALIVEMENPGTLSMPFDFGDGAGGMDDAPADGGTEQGGHRIHPSIEGLRPAGGAFASNGVGLRNLSQRLALHYPGRSRFSLAQRADRTVARLYMTGDPCFA